MADLPAPNSTLQQANLYRKQGRLDEAIALLSGALRSSEAHDLYYARGICYDLADMPDQAIADFTNAIRLAGDNPNYYLHRGEVYSHVLGNNDAAISDFKKCIYLDNNNIRAYQECAMCRIQNEDYESALWLANTAIELNKSNALSYFCSGQALIGLHRYRDAVDMLSQAVAIDPNTSHYWSAFGRACRNLGTEPSLLQSLKAYTQAINLDPGNSLLLYGRAEIKYELGDIEQAKEDLQQALTMSPDQGTRIMIDDLLIRMDN